MPNLITLFFMIERKAGIQGEKFQNKVVRLWERESDMLLRLKNKNKVFLKDQIKSLFRVIVP